MSSWIFTVRDGSTGAAIEGAAIEATINTQCCPDCFPGTGCSCNGCTSGAGYPVVGNTGSDGTLTEDIPYSVPQDVNPITVSAVGYNNTTASYQSGSITGNVNIPTIYLTPLANVPQTNQGAGGSSTTTAGLDTTSFFGGHKEAIEILIAVAVVVIVLLVLIAALKG